MTEKIIPTTKKERTTKSYLHIYVNCLLAVLVYVFCLVTLYKDAEFIVIYVLAIKI